MCWTGRYHFAIKTSANRRRIDFFNKTLQIMSATNSKRQIQKNWSPDHSPVHSVLHYNDCSVFGSLDKDFIIRLGYFQEMLRFYRFEEIRKFWRWLTSNYYVMEENAKESGHTSFSLTFGTDTHACTDKYTQIHKHIHTDTPTHISGPASNHSVIKSRIRNQYCPYSSLFILLMDQFHQLELTYFALILMLSFDYISGKFHTVLFIWWW